MFTANRCVVATTGVKTGKTAIEQISYVYGAQAVVVSIDPRRVYVKDPSEVPYKTIKLQKLGPNGEEYAWYQCTVSRNPLVALIL